jgi:hypothetical protein
MAVMIGIDPHKRSHTAVALNSADEALANYASPPTVGRSIG